MLTVQVDASFSNEQRNAALLRAIKDAKLGGPKVSVGAWREGKAELNGVLHDVWVCDVVREASSAVEHQTDNLGVSGSIPGLRTT